MDIVTTVILHIHIYFPKAVDTGRLPIMHESSTVDCSECGAEVTDDLDLCPQCGAEVDSMSAISTESPRRSGEFGETQTIEPSTSDRDANTSPATTTAYDSANDDDGGGTGSRLGFAAAVGMAGGVFLLAPVFLIGDVAFMAPMLLFSGGADAGMKSSFHSAGVFFASTLTIISGVLCLFASALRLAGVGIAVSKVTGALGILSGGIGIVMIFVV